MPRLDAPATPPNPRLHPITLTREMSHDELRPDRWSPSDEQRSVSIGGDGWSVKIDAGDADIEVDVRESDRDVVVVRYNYGLDPVHEVRATGNVLVHLESAIDGEHEPRGEWTLELLVCGADSTGGWADSTGDLGSPAMMAGDQIATFPAVCIGGSVTVGDFAGAAYFSETKGSLYCRPAHAIHPGDRERGRGCTGRLLEEAPEMLRPGQVLGLKDSQGAVISGADITRLAEGQLGQAALVPDVESLYDMARADDRLSRIISQDRSPPPAWTDRVLSPQQKAQWFRSLDAALGRVAVPASTRAAVRWCYALMEHQTVKDRRRRQEGESALRWLGRFLFSPLALETLGRWLLRAVGYAQRPSRAAACWLLAAAALASLPGAGVRCDPAPGVRCDPAPSSWWERFVEWWERFVGMLQQPAEVVLRLASGEAAAPFAGSSFETLGHLAVGVPFAFFVVSLLKFLRSPLERAHD